MYNIIVANKIRRDILTMSFKAKVAHITSALSMCDYLGVMFEGLITPQTHKFVFGKPFGAQAYYAIFAHYGWIEKSLDKYGTLDDQWRYIIQKDHPLVTFIDETMGNCLSVACGIALADKSVFVNISDAAFQEGTVWESVLFAGAKKLNRIVMSIDFNNMQALGRIQDIFPLSPLDEKLESCGWRVLSCDGHDIEAIRHCCIIASELSERPTAIIFKTRKGGGVSFMENDASWHYRLLDEITYTKALEELL